MNGHLNQCQHTDVLKLYTEISSLTRIFHEKPASTGSRASFLKNHGPQKKDHKTESIAEKKCVRLEIRS